MLIRPAARSEKNNNPSASADEMLRAQKAALDRLALVSETDLDGTITYVNDLFVQVSQYSREELIGQKQRIVNSQYHPPEFWKTLWKTIGQGQVWRGEIRNRAKDGSIYWIDASVVPLLDVHGRPVRYLAIDAVITERKEVEEDLRTALAEVQAANRELTDFAHIVSHDLKAPLRAIGSLAEWIAKDYSHLFDADGKEQIALLSGRVQRMHALIDGILCYSRAGSLREEKVVCSIKTLAQDAIDLISPPGHIQIVFEGTWPSLSCEKTRMTQVFQNLISNAVKFMDKPQGRIALRCDAEAESWHMTVSDNGPGIEEKDFDRIFHIFQTLAPRDQRESTGVGLSVVKKIVDLTQGRIWVESKPGQGSTFHVLLPKETA